MFFADDVYKEVGRRDRPMRRPLLFVLSMAASVLAIGAVVLGCSGEKVLRQDSEIFTTPSHERCTVQLRQQKIIDPRAGAPHVALGRIFIKESMNAKAEEEFEAAIKLEPQFMDAYVLAAYAIEAQPKPDLPKAITLLQQAVRLRPEYAQAHLSLAQSYAKMELNRQAVAEYENTIKLTRDPAARLSAHLGLMAVYQKTGNSEKADKEYESARRIYPTIDDLIKDVEISRLTPVPRYGAEGYRGEEDLIHPPLMDRMRKVREEINRSSGKREWEDCGELR